MPTYTPPAELREACHVSSRDQYDRMYKRSVDDPEGFWGEIADQFHWETKVPAPATADAMPLHNRLAGAAADRTDFWQPQTATHARSGCFVLICGSDGCVGYGAGSARRGTSSTTSTCGRGESSPAGLGARRPTSPTTAWIVTSRRCNLPPDASGTSKQQGLGIQESKKPEEKPNLQPLQPDWTCQPPTLVPLRCAVAKKLFQRRSTALLSCSIIKCSGCQTGGSWQSPSGRPILHQVRSGGAGASPLLTKGGPTCRPRNRLQHILLDIIPRVNRNGAPATA